jgi:hypothetical protein
LQIVSMSHSDQRTLTRREALLGTLKATLVSSLGLPAVADASPAPVPVPEPDFVPENDYPFFGGELPEGYRSTWADTREQPHETSSKLS